MDNLDKITKILKEWIDEKKTGSIQINFFKGGIGNLNLSNSIKLDTTKTKEVQNDKGKRHSY